MPINTTQQLRPVCCFIFSWPGYLIRWSDYRRTFSTTLRKTSKPVNHKKVNKKKPLLIVRRIIDSRGQYQSTEVDIKSEALCDLLLTINEDVYGLTLTKSRAIVRCYRIRYILNRD